VSAISYSLRLRSDSALMSTDIASQAGKRSRLASPDDLPSDAATPGVSSAARDEAANASDGDDDDDFGPMPVSASDAVPAKKRRLQHEKLYLNHIPAADRYYRSFMHRDTVTQVAITKCVHLGSRVAVD
jgi:peptidylprolyl isomerase domain and WD repeat-containing protein 1